MDQVVFLQTLTEQGRIFMSDIDQERQQGITLPIKTSFPPTVYTIDGPLPGGRYLAHPLAVLVEEDEGEFLASEPHYYIHASGSTVPEAIASFKRVLSGYLDDLASDEERLSEYLHKQLQYLRSVVKLHCPERMP